MSLQLHIKPVQRSRSSDRSGSGGVARERTLSTGADDVVGEPRPLATRILPMTRRAFPTSFVHYILPADAYGAGGSHSIVPISAIQIRAIAEK